MGVALAGAEEAVAVAGAAVAAAVAAGALPYSVLLGLETVLIAEARTVDGRRINLSIQADTGAIEV